MTTHQFGGDWTTEKLERVRKYLSAYTTIFAKNERAQYFIYTYVDAFAGTGYRTASQPDGLNLLLPELADAENEAFLKGSARIALEVEPPFKGYIFIERDPERAIELERLKTTFSNRAPLIKIENSEANDYLLKWCRATDWSKNRAVVFLDPYGMQVEWTLIDTIAQTKAIDLWILFPLGVAVNRMLPKSGPPPASWAQALNRLFGNNDWQAAFYPSQKVLTLFGEEEIRSRQANIDKIGEYFVSRLKTVFTAVAENPLPLFNSKNNPLYLLCFASGNPKGSRIAIKIAQDILRR